MRARRPLHGRTSPIAHDGSGIFAGLPSPLRATRYHSLVIARESVPEALRVTAVAADDGEIMAVEHQAHPVVGVQFHPESAATEHGYALLDRFLHGGRARASGLPLGADGASRPPMAHDPDRPGHVDTGFALIYLVTLDGPEPHGLSHGVSLASRGCPHSPPQPSLLV